jgi:hypothetical protein
MDESRLLGPIRHLQIQKETLRIGVRPNRVYRTDPLASVPALVLSPGGALAKIDGGWMVDVHHAAHPASAEPNLERLLSVGFTSHYAAMAEHFGSATVGDAGENLIVETDGIITEDHIAGGLLIERPGGNIELQEPVVAEPCVPFTRFRLGDPEADLELVNPEREFLRGGMRGYVMGLSNLAGAVEVEVGDLVYARTQRTLP